MLDIGSSLREERLRRGLELDEVASATLIRNRYLEALEHGRYDLLPQGFYRRGFLRRYAEFLGLDADAVLERYDRQLAADEPPRPSEPLRSRFARPRLPARLDPARLPGGWPLALVALAGVIGVAAWQLSGGGGPPRRSPAAAVTASRPAARRTQPRPSRAHAALESPVLALSARGGSCWLEVRAGSASGRLLLVTTLRPGDTLRLGLRRALWIRFGAPRNLTARLAGRDLSPELPAGPGDVRASSAGLRSVA